MPANVSYSVPGEKWKRTNDLIKAVDLRIGKLDPRSSSSRSDAFQVRYTQGGLERCEEDSIEAVLGLFVDKQKSHHLPSYRSGGSGEDVLWLQRFLERLKPDAKSYIWTLQEQSRVPPHGAFLFMVRRTGMAVPEPGVPLPEGILGPLVDHRRAGPGYFAAMEIDLIGGRELTWEDGADDVRSVVVSETLARTFWPNESSALQRRIRFQGEEAESWVVVGVAQDVRFETLVEEPAPLIYFPVTAGSVSGSDPARTVAAVLHVGADPLSFIPAAREALREVDPRLPMIDPTTVERVARDAMSATSFTALLLGISAFIALALGTVGIYGVISYVVSRRTQEIGVRMALGAPAGLVLRDVVTQGMTLTGLGLIVGLAAALGVSRLLSSLLYGVSATDPLTYAGTALALAVVALLASWLPARKAASVDVVEALRME